MTANVFLRYCSFYLNISEGNNTPVCSFIQKWLFSEMRPKLQWSLERYYGYYHELVDVYRLSVSRLNGIYTYFQCKHLLPILVKGFGTSYLYFALTLGNQSLFRSLICLLYYLLDDWLIVIDFQKSVINSTT